MYCLCLLSKTGFVAERVIGLSLRESRRLSPDRNLIDRTLELIGQAKPGRSFGPRDTARDYTLELLTGSSFESQKLIVQVTPEGDGWFQKGGGKRVSFFSPELGAVLAKQLTYQPNNRF